jgi:hypothetical protein
MKKIIIFLAVFSLMSCLSDKKEKEGDSEKEEQLMNEEQAINEEPILGERVEGPVSVRDTIDGKVIFTLNDNVLIETVHEENGWNVIGILPTNPESDFEDGVLKKGVKILVDKQVVGKTKKEVELMMGLVGYIQKENIKPNTIIENAIMSHFEENKDSREFVNFKKIISNFKLQKDDQFDGMTIYYNYENWIVDPSPMMRIGLVFKNERLIAVLHSRPLVIEGTKDNKLDHAFDCITFKDVENADGIVKIFNHFVNSGD